MLFVSVLSYSSLFFDDTDVRTMHSDDVVERALPIFMGAHADLTPQDCVTLCAGYTYAGVEYANECCTSPPFSSPHSPTFTVHADFLSPSLR